MRERTWWIAMGACVALVVAGGVAAAQSLDWGLKIEKQTSDKTKDLFGVGSALSETSTSSLTEAQALADPAALVTVSNGSTGPQPTGSARTTISGAVSTTVRTWTS